MEKSGERWKNQRARNFVYLNHVLKFRAIGIRGPWTSGGIEHNFGLDIGHAPWTASPVDYIIHKDPDGSVSCTVGGIDLGSRTQWRVTIRLPRDKAYFETNSLWYNPTPYHHSYLAWENAAFRASDDLQFYFPGNHYIGHDGSAYPWPVDKEGRNLSLYRENYFGSSKSYHVMGAYSNWFGGYWHDEEFGFGHWSPYTDAPGKKIWIWSLARDGAIWEDLLTDRDGQYIEAQSGVKFNQADLVSGFHSPFKQLSLRPGYSEIKTDIWFPVKGTKGMADAGSSGTLQVTQANDSLHIWISPLEEINDSLVVSIGNRRQYWSMLHLKPMETYHHLVLLPAKNSGNIKVRVGNGKLIYESDPGEYVSDRPVVYPPGEGYNDAERLFMLAEDKNSMRLHQEAMDDYLACIEKEPTHTNALARIAELYYRRAQYDEASAYARRALAINTYHPAANYIYGIVQQRKGRLEEAEEALSIAVRTLEFRAEAYTRIAGICMQKQAYERAIVNAKKALDYNRFNLTAHALLGTGYRKSRRLREAINTFNELLRIDPLSHYARFEKYLLNVSPRSLAAFQSCITNEYPHETYLELAIQYSTWGLREEAVQVLQLSPPHPMVYYWLAYLQKDVSVAVSMRYHEMAEKISPAFVFPFREETIPVLTWALSLRDSWKTTYYLGLIYWSKLRLAEAKDLFRRCGNRPDFAPFYVARGELFQNDSSIQDDYAGDSFKRAVALEPGQWRTWHHLINHFLEGGNYQPALDYSSQAYSKFPDNAVVKLDYAKTLLCSRKFEECLDVLAMVRVLPQEGAQEGHDLYEEACLSLALEKLKNNELEAAIKYLDESKKWPEYLGAGRPFDPDTRFQDYIAAYCELMLGRKERSEQRIQAVTAFTLQHWPRSAKPLYNFIGVSMLKRSGEAAKAAQLLDAWKTELDSLDNWGIPAHVPAPAVKWIYAGFYDNLEEARNAETEMNAGPSDRMSRIFFEVMNLTRREMYK